MTDVPKDAREQLAAIAARNDALGGAKCLVPLWAVPLALRQLDLEAVAGEAVTEEMVNAAWDAHADGAASEVLANPGQIHEALLAVAPALVLAGERRGLERAVAVAKRRRDELQAAHAKDPDNLALDARRIEAFGTYEELLALGRPA